MIVEDDAATLAQFVRKVEQCPDLTVCAQARSCAQARDLLDAEAPDVLLVDLGLPDGDGVEVIEHAWNMSADIAIMVITVFGDEEPVMRAIRSGAAGYLLKTDQSKDVCESIHELLAGGSPISPMIARYLIRMHQAPGTDQSGADLGLSERELEVLKLSAKGYTYQEVANLMNLSVNTVGSHTRHVYRKLAVHSRSEAVYEATRLGLVDAPDRDE